MRGGRILIAVVAVAALATCDLLAPKPVNTKRVQGGDAERGFALIATGAHGCQACHAIPGIRTPKGVAGPALEGMASRSFIAGQLPNRPGVLVAFLQNPPALVPGTGMPNVGLDLQQARDMAAYLYTLEGPDAH